MAPASEREEFRLDTSGVVRSPEANAWETTDIAWSDLTPFVQGYVEALFASELPDGAQLRGKHIPLGFSDLAPEALARIIADCEEIQATFPVSPNYEGGWQAWCVRRDGGFDMGGKWPSLPPQTPALGDDGKVRLS